MKKTIYNKIVVVVAIATVFTGCSDSFLEQTNPNQTNVAAFWKTADDLLIGTTSVYNALKSQDIMLLSEETKRSDLAFPGFGKPNTGDVYYLQIFNNSASAPNNKWGALYRGIFRANQVIDAYDRILPTLTSVTDIARVKAYYAEARALRGMFYFYLYSSFNNGSVMLFEHDPSDTNDFHKPLSPAATIQKFYLDDLLYAKTNLPATRATAEKGRITSTAVTALMGQSYLFEKNYIMAASLFKEIINNTSYSLAADIGSNFTTRDEHNSESILEINYSTDFKNGISANDLQQVSNTLGSAMAPGNLGGFRTVLPSSWLTMAYKKDKPDTKDPRNMALSSDGVTVKARKYSLRASQSLALADDDFTPYYLTPNAGEGTLFNGSEPGYFRKYTNWDIVSNEKNVASTFYRSGINFRVIRLADVYLMYAEAMIEGGTKEAGLSEALLYVNKVRHRSAVQLLGPDGSGEFPSNDHDNSTYTAATLMNHLMFTERPLELAIEGHAIRTIDMRRWGIAKARFQELATRRYYVTDHLIPVSLVTGKAITRFGALLSDNDDPVPTPVNGTVLVKPNITFNEFGNTATNFDPTKHSYWDIPSSELTSNNSFTN
ncbi:RagB/SusD family nutrient uptake outer membrane protein [Flavobacterium ovatum]|uniref:RagB/SusD family nutrient uptake outer membrane protein n=1 Tax=Flavobacterium ovatum TaxID=1928857 RepID=UPI00344C6C40